MKYSTYLFDFDGTLVNSMPPYVRVMYKMLDEYGVEYGSDVIKTITPLGYAGTAKYFVEVLGVKASEQEVFEQMKQYMLYEYTHNVHPKPGAIEALSALKAAGADLYVLTATPHLLVDPCVQALGIKELFLEVWSSDDFGTVKANPEIYGMATDRIGLPMEKVLFLDDNYDAIKAAKRAGMTVCGVYDVASEEYVDGIKRDADYFVRDLSEVLEI